jgi:hypothetical protein
MSSVRLTVGDDGQRLQRRPAELARLQSGAGEMRGHLGRGPKGPGAALPLEPNAAFGIVRLQLGQEIGHGRRAELDLEQLLLHRLLGREQDGFQDLLGLGLAHRWLSGDGS